MQHQCDQLRPATAHRQLRRNLVEQLILTLHARLGHALATEDWTDAVAYLELLGDCHRAIGSEIAVMSYQRAWQIAEAKQIKCVDRLERKLSLREVMLKTK